MKSLITFFLFQTKTKYARASSLHGCKGCRHIELDLVKIVQQTNYMDQQGHFDCLFGCTDCDSLNKMSCF